MLGIRRGVKLFLRLIILVNLIAAPTVAFANDVALFDSAGAATAYVAIDDELTIYLWGGEPVAYLKQDSVGGFHLYGFNGKHLGWFVDGVVRDHSGDAACATNERLRSTAAEPFKAFKKFKPFKSFEEFAPFRPFFSNSWTRAACQFLLIEGER